MSRKHVHQTYVHRRKLREGSEEVKQEGDDLLGRRRELCHGRAAREIRESSPGRLIDCPVSLARTGGHGLNSTFA